jgi:hypothetical protein
MGDVCHMQGAKWAQFQQFENSSLEMIDVCLQRDLHIVVIYQTLWDANGKEIRPQSNGLAKCSKSGMKRKFMSNIKTLERHSEFIHSIEP